ncbi:putative RAD50-interacting protein 1 [Blattamonas nauphoetae]|uniref:RAD50-interacting protein 1 n=1 Tax=Blattamonas nauphoetae TaxID=2049346 RepID=A0ABQ9YKE3_9EUKA|nr:putative RAD50-interacting protein 1 [Blattamonas nauphoetae]
MAAIFINSTLNSKKATPSDIKSLLDELQQNISIKESQQTSHDRQVQEGRNSALSELNSVKEELAKLETEKQTLTDSINEIKTSFEQVTELESPVHKLLPLLLEQKYLQLQQSIEHTCISIDSLLQTDSRKDRMTAIETLIDLVKLNSSANTLFPTSYLAKYSSKWLNDFTLKIQTLFSQDLVNIINATSFPDNAITHTSMPIPRNSLIIPSIGFGGKTKPKPTSNSTSQEESENVRDRRQIPNDTVQSNSLSNSDSQETDNSVISFITSLASTARLKPTLQILLQSIRNISVLLIQLQLAVPSIHSQTLPIPIQLFAEPIINKFYRLFANDTSSNDPTKPDVMFYEMNTILKRHQPFFVGEMTEILKESGWPDCDAWSLLVTTVLRPLQDKLKSDITSVFASYNITFTENQPQHETILQGTLLSSTYPPFLCKTIVHIVSEMMAFDDQLQTSLGIAPPSLNHLSFDSTANMSNTMSIFISMPEAFTHLIKIESRTALDRTKEIFADPSLQALACELPFDPFHTVRFAYLFHLLLNGLVKRHSHIISLGPAGAHLSLQYFEKVITPVLNQALKDIGIMSKATTMEAKTHKTSLPSTFYDQVNMIGYLPLSDELEEASKALNIKTLSQLPPYSTPLYVPRHSVLFTNSLEMLITMFRNISLQPDYVAFSADFHRINKTTGLVFDSTINELKAMQNVALKKIDDQIAQTFITMLKPHLMRPEQYQISKPPTSTTNSPLHVAVSAITSTLLTIQPYTIQPLFRHMWMAAASAIDTALYSSIILSPQFSFTPSGVLKLNADFTFITQSFSSFSKKPDTYFPYCRESVLLLSQSPNTLSQFLKMNEKGKERFLQDLDIVSITIIDATSVLTRYSSR